MAGLFLAGTAAANVLTHDDHFTQPVNFKDADPIEFTERGIRFFVFADGQFDFSTETSTGSDVYYRQTGRRSVNATYGAPNTVRTGGVRIEHDKKGRVRRVGNVFINYDAYDRIKRIGSVYMTYNRFALAQVGGLKLYYNSRGQIIDMQGTVNGYSDQAYGYNNSYYGPANGSAYGNNYQDNDDYYYRKAVVKK